MFNLHGCIVQELMHYPLERGVVHLFGNARVKRRARLDDSQQNNQLDSVRRRSVLGLTRLTIASASESDALSSYVWLYLNRG